MILSKVLPGKTIGIIGGGQLGRMMAMEAKKMGYFIAVVDPTDNSPCGQIADVEIVAEYSDMEAMKKLAEVSDVITYEFENIDYEALLWLEENAYLPQRSELLQITQNRATEKKAVQDAGAQVAPYFIVDTKEQVIDAVNTLGLPCVLKTCRGGYDGKGQYVIKEMNELDEASKLLNIGQCVLEAWIPFEKEISVIVTRSVSGEIKTFPVAENIHVENILHESIVPARISKDVKQEAIDRAIQLAESFKLVGTLAVEMFVTSEGEIFINELAPRPHNSGHYTMDACLTSQFEQHIRAICDWPLGSTELLKPVVMVNILGQHLEDVLNQLDTFSDCKLHLYGKKEAKFKRKMGHINFLANDSNECLTKIDELKIWSKS